MAFPIELLTLGGSTIGSFCMKLVGTWMQNKADERELLITQQRMEVEQHKMLVNKGGGFAVTRRVIALTAVAALLVWPKFAGLLDLPVYVPYIDVDSTRVLWGLFTSSDSASGFRTFLGVPVFSSDGHLLAAIFGLYFGSTLANRG